MIPSIKSEARKLYSIRSTYVIIIVTLLLLFLFAFIGNGTKVDSSTLLFHDAIANDITATTSVLALLGALISLMLFSHEYRYNLIMHTLTLTNSRNKVILSKIFVITVFSIIFTLVFSAISPLLSLLAIHLKNYKIVSQSIPYQSILPRIVLYGWGYSMFGLMLAVLIRNQIGAIVALILIPGTIEPILHLIFQQNTIYLPFTALNSMLGHDRDLTVKSVSHFEAALIFLIYLVIGWLIAWLLFLKRDAN